LHRVLAAGARIADGQIPSRYSQRLARFQTPRFSAAGTGHPRQSRQAKRLDKLARARGQTLAQMALVWVLRHPGMTSALVGASRVAQIEDAVGALNNLTLGADELREIEAILKN